MTDEDDRFKCSVCRQPKLSLESHGTLTGMKVLKCQTCIGKGFEPRELLIIAYRSDRLSKRAAKLIRERKYCGQEIALAEIL
jgi:hypothetical protein